MDVADLEAGALPRQAARPERREPPLVGQLGQRVGLVHELRQLAGPEERLDHGAHGPGVDQVIERDLLRVGVDAHPLLDQPRHAREAHRELVGDQLADRPDPAVAQVVDVVGVAAPVVQVNQVLDDRDEVLFRQDRGVHVGLEPQPLVDLVAAHPPEVVALRVEEQPLQLLPRGLQVRRIAGPQQRIDLLERLGLAVGRVLGQGVLDQRRLRPARGQQDVHPGDPGLFQLLPARLGELLARLGQHLPGLRVGHVEGEDVVALVPRGGRLLHVGQVQGGVAREGGDRLDPDLPHGVDPLDGELVAHPAERVPIAILGIRHVGRQQRADHLAPLLPALELAGDAERLGGEEEPQDVGVLPVPEGAQEGRRRELLLLVDVHVDDIMDVDGELHPRAPERNDPRRVEALPVGMGVLLEDHARRAVQLAHHDALGAVDHEGPQRGHDRQLAEVDFLLDDVLGPTVALDFLEDHQLQRGLEGGGIGHVALNALLDGVLGLAQRIAQEVQRILPVDVANREEVAEDALQRHVLARARDVIGHQQGLEGPRLDVEEVRHRHAALALRETDHRSQIHHRSLSGNTKGPVVRVGPPWRVTLTGLQSRRELGVARRSHAVSPK